MKLRQVTNTNRGFGLAAAAHLVENRGGRIWMAAPLFEQGTTICFELPGAIAWEPETEIAPALSA